MKKNSIKFFDRLYNLSLSLKIFLNIVIIIGVIGFVFLYSNHKLIKNGNIGTFDVEYSSIVDNITNDHTKDEDSEVSEIHDYNMVFGDIYAREIIVEYGEIDNDFTLSATLTKENTYGKLEDYVAGRKCFKVLNKCYINADSIVRELKMSVNVPVEIKTIKINNQIVFNYFLCFVILISIYLISYVIRNYKAISEKLHIIALIFSLGFGLIIIFCFPAKMHLCWDDQIHFRNSITLLDFNGTRITEAEKELIDVEYKGGGYNKRESKEYEKKLLKIDKNEVENLDYNGNLNLTSFAYLPYYLTYKTTKLFGINILARVRIAKIVTLIIYSVLISYAIKKATRYKTLLLFLGILPTAVNLAANYSYDNMINSFTLLFLSKLICCIDSKKVYAKDIMILLTLGLFGYSAKAIYGLMLLLILLIPKEKFCNDKVRKIAVLSSIFATVLILSTFILPTILNPSIGGDVRGGSAVSMQGQINAIIHQPLSFVKVFFGSIYDTIGNFLFSSELYMNYHCYISTNYFIYFIMIMVVILTYLLSCKDSKITKKGRILVLVIFAFIVCFIYGSMLLSFNEVRSETIKGVQARYFMPILSLPIFAFVSSKYKLDSKNESNILLLMIFLYIIVYLLSFVEVILPFMF